MGLKHNNCKNKQPSIVTHQSCPSFTKRHLNVSTFEDLRSCSGNSWSCFLIATLSVSGGGWSPIHKELGENRDCSWNSHIHDSDIYCREPQWSQSNLLTNGSFWEQPENILNCGRHTHPSPHHQNILFWNDDTHAGCFLFKRSTNQSITGVPKLRKPRKKLSDDDPLGWKGLSCSWQSINLIIAHSWKMHRH